MKKIEKDKAIELRKEGKSLNEIVRILGVSKASVSKWVRDVELTDTQRARLTANGFSVDAVEKRRINRMKGTSEKHAAIMNEAKKEIEDLSEYELELVGAALYWGEGGKTNKGMARITNSDQNVIRIMMRFFREIFKVPEEKFRGHIHTFSHLNIEAAEEYWSKISGIPRSQFFKTYSKPSIASLNKKDSLPYGTFEICVCDTKIFLRTMGWIEGLKELTETKLDAKPELAQLGS